MIFEVKSLTTGSKLIQAVEATGSKVTREQALVQKYHAIAGYTARFFVVGCCNCCIVSQQSVGCLEEEVGLIVLVKNCIIMGDSSVTTVSKSWWAKSPHNSYSYVCGAVA